MSAARLFNSVWVYSTWPFSPYFPTSRGNCFVLIKPTTVAPRSLPTPVPQVRISGTRALRFVTSAHIPTGKLQRKRRLVSARILFHHFQTRIKITAAQPTHYRQAKGNSRNPLTIAICLPDVNTPSGKTVLGRPESCYQVSHNSPRTRGLPSLYGLL